MAVNIMLMLTEHLWHCPLCHAIGTVRWEKQGLFAPKILNCTACQAHWEVKGRAMTLMGEGNASDAGPSPTTTDGWISLVQSVMPPLQPIAAGAVTLQKGEAAYLSFPSATLYEEQTIRHTSGGGRGVSVRVARGVYLRSGGGRATTTYDKQLRATATGQLTLTSKRILYRWRSADPPNTA
ncbi:MAG: hypothetical protein M0Z94_02790, partial [Dehalococcoidales bacterium]|nr:hypothetical protein [Dehalococcoidales bacterium]